MTPLQRSARAMAQARYGYDAWKQEDADGRQRLLAEARAVIEAIREPSEAMLLAGEAAPPNEASHPNDIEPGAAQIWPAMIDALLEEGQ